MIFMLQSPVYLAKVGGVYILRLGQQLNATLQLIPKQHYDDILEVLQLGTKLFGLSGSQT